MVSPNAGCGSRRLYATVPARETDRRFRADRGPRSCVSAAPLRASRRGPGSRAARLWRRRRRPMPTRPPTSVPSDLLRRSPPHARSSRSSHSRILATGGDAGTGPGPYGKSPGALYAESARGVALSFLLIARCARTPHPGSSIRSGGAPASHLRQLSTAPSFERRPSAVTTHGRFVQGGLCRTCWSCPHASSATQSFALSRWKPTIG
jgi:hypothetical protein